MVATPLALRSKVSTFYPASLMQYPRVADPSKLIGYFLRLICLRLFLPRCLLCPFLTDIRAGELKLKGEITNNGTLSYT
jgi:hypothetical protein